jgi:hypothetical protein
MTSKYEIPDEEAEVGELPLAGGVDGEVLYDSEDDVVDVEPVVAGGVLVLVLGVGVFEEEVVVVGLAK